MTDIYLRPRFSRNLICSVAEVFQRFRDASGGTSDGIRVSVYSNTCVLKVPAEKVRFWSPQLHLSVEPDEQDHSVLHGIFGPRPSVWSVFIALYVGIGFLGCMGVIYGLSKWSIGESKVALWAGPIAILLAIAVYVVGRIGRRFGMEQMIQLRDYMDGVLKGCNP